MTITLNKYATSTKDELTVITSKPLFDMDKLASKKTISKYDKYFRSIETIEYNLDKVLYTY